MPGPSPLRAAGLLAGGLLAGLLLVLTLLSQAFGREPAAAWVCDDTRYTQLVPRGRAVVGPPVSPPPGCAP